MFRNLIIIFLLLLVSCSSEDDSSSSQSLFLEKYDGVVWEETNDDPVYRFGFIFNNSPQSWTSYEFDEGDGDCLIREFGTVFQDGTTASIISSSNEDELILEVTDFVDGGVLDTYTLTITAVNDGENLVIEYSNDPTGDEFFERIFGNPCN